MKKYTILLLGLIMSGSFLALLSLQVRYIEEIVSMRHEQFDESVKRSLYNAAHKQELYETMRYLERDMAEAEIIDRLTRQGGNGMVTRQYDFKSDGNTSSFEMRTIIIPQRSMADKKDIPDASRSLQETIRNRYIRQRGLMDEVIYKMLYTASNKPLEQRVDIEALDRDPNCQIETR